MFEYYPYFYIDQLFGDKTNTNHVKNKYPPADFPNISANVYQFLIIYYCRVSYITMF